MENPRALMRTSHTRVPMRRTPPTLTNNPLPLTTCWRTLRRIIAAVPADMQFVTGSEDPSAPIGKTRKLPIPQSNRPSLRRRTRKTSDANEPQNFRCEGTARISSSISLPPTTYRYALRHNDTSVFAGIQFPIRAVDL